MLCLGEGEGGFVAPGTNFPIIKGCLTASSGYHLQLQFGHYNVQFSFVLSIKIFKNLPSKVGYFCKVEETAQTTQNYKSVLEIWLGIPLLYFL